MIAIAFIWPILSFQSRKSKKKKKKKKEEEEEKKRNTKQNTKRVQKYQIPIRFNDRNSKYFDRTFKNGRGNLQTKNILY